MALSVSERTGEAALKLSGGGDLQSGNCQQRNETAPAAARLHPVAQGLLKWSSWTPLYAKMKRSWLL
jgi:hypothetical protein